MSQQCRKCLVEKNVNEFKGKHGSLFKRCLACREHRNTFSKCIHNRFKFNCIDCGGNSICNHKKLKYICKECNGSSICMHDTQKLHCKKCTDPIKVTVKNWIYLTKDSDIKKNRYDANSHIDKCFLESLIEESTICPYCDVEMQFKDYDDTLCTIERKDNKIGHTKANCILACMKCNKSRVGQK